MFALARPSEPFPPMRHPPSDGSDALPAEVLDSLPATGSLPQLQPTGADGPPMATLPPETERTSALVLVVTSLALLLGLAALALVTRLPVAALLLAILGIACGCLALSRGGLRAGILALLVCGLAVWLACFWLAVAMYVATYHVVPWSPSAPPASFLPYLSFPLGTKFRHGNAKAKSWKRHKASDGVPTG